MIGNGKEGIIQEIFNGSTEGFRTFCKDSGFNDVAPEYALSFGGREFYLNHYPRKRRGNCVNLFGHTHRATGLWKPYGLNVGVDLNSFRPFSESDILELVDTKENWWDLDEDCLDM